MQEVPPQTRSVCRSVSGAGHTAVPTVVTRAVPGLSAQRRWRLPSYFSAGCDMLRMQAVANPCLARGVDRLRRLRMNGRLALSSRPPRPSTKHAGLSDDDGPSGIDWVLRRRGVCASSGRLSKTVAKARSLRPVLLGRPLLGRRGQGARASCEQRGSRARARRQRGARSRRATSGAERGEGGGRGRGAVARARARSLCRTQKCWGRERGA